MDYTLIIKITNGCNLNCSYCYHRRDKSRDFSRTMTLETLDLLIKQIIDHNEDRVEFIWHGGEPLLAGLDTYQYIIDKQNEYNKDKGIKISNSIQTNGTLLNDDYISFFNDNKFDVGISIDGPYDMHAKQRGTDTSEYLTILSSLKKLGDRTKKYGTLCVVGKQHIGCAKEIFDLLCEYEIHNIGFLPCVIEKDEYIDEEHSISQKEYAAFLIDFFDIWINGDFHGLSVRNIDDCIRFFLGKPSKNCIHANSCDRYLTVMPEGNIYLCDNFSSNESNYVGHISNGFNNIDECAPMVWLKRSMSYIPSECTQCRYYNGCHSGCKHRRWLRDHTMNRGHYYCLSTRMFYDHVGQYFKETGK